MQITFEYKVQVSEKGNNPEPCTKNVGSLNIDLKDDHLSYCRNKMPESTVLKNCK